MGLLRDHQNNGRIPYYTGLQIQTSGNNVPISIVWGANKIAPNCIWTGGFYGYYGYPEGSHGGGKGGEGGGSTSQGWQYYTSWLMGLCEGPISGIGTIWQGSTPTNTYGADIWAVYNGTQSQTPWSYLSTYFAPQALGYHGLAYIASYNNYLGNTANLPQYSIEVLGLQINSSGINGLDADPAQIVYDFLTNAQYGLGSSNSAVSYNGIGNGFSGSSINATSLYSDWRHVTIATGSPAVVTWGSSIFSPAAASAPPLLDGSQVILTTTGSLPSGIRSDTVYYLANISGSSANLVYSPGGVLVNASGSQSGTHTLTLNPSSYQAYCRAAYLALSPVLTNQEPASSILARWMQLTNSAAVWSGGELKIIPYGDSAISQPHQFIGTVTYIPNTTPVYSLDDDDFINEEGQDPVEASRVDPYELYNWRRLQINERINAYLPLNVNEPWQLWTLDNSYVPRPIDVWDQNAIETYGLRMAPDITANEICDPQVGQNAAQLILQRGLYVRNHYKFKLSFEYCLLEPMDLVQITDTRIGLNALTVRITEVSEDDSGILSIMAEDWLGTTGTSVAYPIQPHTPNGINQNVVPARVNTPVIFEPPSSLTNGIPYVFIAASGGVAPVYYLAETGSTGQHSVTWAGQASLASGSTVNFSLYICPNIRNSLRLNIYNGSAYIGADFNTVAQTDTADAGVSASIAPATNDASSAISISIASPGVVTWTGNGLIAGQMVVFFTTGTFPGGITASSNPAISIAYFVTSPAANTFEISTTPGGAAINTSGSYSGTITCAAYGWYQCTVSAQMAVAGTPNYVALLEAVPGTTSYAGTFGYGAYLWGATEASTPPQNSVVTQAIVPATYLPPPVASSQVSLANASSATSALMPPSGVPGDADPNWGGCYVWASADGNSYSVIGQINGPSRQGILTAALPVYEGINPDNTDTLSVNLLESSGVLSGTSTSAAANGATLCYIVSPSGSGGEILTYTSAGLVSTSNYSLTGLYRGYGGTATAAHSMGDYFVRVDSNVFRYALPSSWIGATLYVKLQSFNIYGNSVEDLSECAVYTYTVSGAGSQYTYGPITAALLSGTSLDFGLVSAAVTESDQWGIVTDGYLLARIDLGAGI